MSPNQEPLKCANGHILQPEAHTNHSCDLCRKQLTFFCCRQCNYDMCLKCARGVELPLSEELLKRSLPEYDVSSDGGNGYSVKKGDECFYCLCGGVCHDAYFKYSVAVGDKGLTVENNVINMGVADPRLHFIVEKARICELVLKAFVEELTRHEAYLDQAETQKAAAGGSAPAGTLTAPTPVVMGRPEADLSAQLEKLVEMHKSGALTDEEFQQAKRAAIAKSNCN